MPKRLFMTNADYVTIALSPALIMTLIGSLVFFLIEVFYRGQFQGRVTYVFALYVFAAVLVGRISIEEGNDRAVLFGIPLAAATLFVVNTFIAGHFLVNLTIIAIIWWCAHKLTWDCTVIDDREDASGEGLLHAAGLAPSAAESLNADAVGEKKEEKNKRPSVADKRRAKLTAEAPSENLPDGASPNASPAEPAPSWWDQYVERRRRRHVPGVWVVYFSLAALPMFGLLNAAIPSSGGGRSFAFKMLILYVGSALGLLLTTSFLGLRRYLRQRRLEMPAPMAGTWVGIGAAMIVAVLIICSLLPLPDGESSFWCLPIQLSSRDDLSASQYAILNRDGVKDQSPGTGESQGDAQTGSQTRSPSDARGAQSAADGNGTGQPSKSGSGGSKGKKSQQRDSSNKQPSKSDQEQKQQPQQQQENQSEKQQQPQQRQEEGQRQDKSEAQQSQAKSQPPDERDKSVDKEAEKKQRESSARRSQQPSQPPWRPPIEPIAGLSWLGALAKMVFFLALAILVIYLLVRYRHRVVAALRQLIEELRDLWNGLWGRRATQTAEPEEQPASIAAPPRPFADFADPFMSGAAQSMPPHELVRYSIAAFEAWSREHGHPRDPELTVRELVSLSTPPGTPLAKHAQTLANLHGQAAYTDLPLTAAEVHRLRDLWYAMRD